MRSILLLTLLLPALALANPFPKGDPKIGEKLAKEKAVVVKVKKPGQDFRFDLPATGLTTIKTLQQAKGAVLAVEAGQSLLFDRQEMIAEANKAGIVVVGVTECEDGSLVME